MEYVLFTNGTQESREVARALLGTSLPVKVMRQKYADGKLPALIGPAGTFRGRSEIDFFMGGIGRDTPSGRNADE